MAICGLLVGSLGSSTAATVELSEVEMTASNYGGNVGVLRSKLSWLRFLQHLVGERVKKDYLDLLGC